MNNTAVVMNCPSDDSKKVVSLHGKPSIEKNNTAIAKNADSTNANNLVAAYALLRKVLSQDTIISANLTTTFNNLQDSLENVVKNETDSMASTVVKRGGIIDDLNKYVPGFNAVGGVALGLLILGLLTGNVFLMALGTAAGAVSAIGSIVGDAQKIKAAQLQYKVAQQEGDINKVQATVTSVTNTNKNAMSKLKQLMQTQGNLNETLNSAISDVAKAIQALSQRVR